MPMPLSSTSVNQNAAVLLQMTPFHVYCFYSHAVSKNVSPILNPRQRGDFLRKEFKSRKNWSADWSRRSSFLGVFGQLTPVRSSPNVVGGNFSPTQGEKWRVTEQKTELVTMDSVFPFCSCSPLASDLYRLVSRTGNPDAIKL